MRSRRRWSLLSALVRATLRQEEWMTVREAAALYRVTDETMLRGCAPGRSRCRSRRDERAWRARRSKRRCIVCRDATATTATIRATPPMR